MQPLFGKITNADTQPGRAFMDFRGQIIHATARTERTLSRGLGVEGDWDHENNRVPSATIGYLADVYTKQPDGSYRRTEKDADTPILMTDGDSNPYCDPVKVQIDGDRLTVVG